MSLLARMGKMQATQTLQRKAGPGNFPTRWNPHTRTVGPTVSQRPTVYRDPYMGDPGIFGDIGRFIGGAVKSVPLVGGLAGGAITGLANALDPVKRQQAPLLNPMFQQAPVVPKPGVMGAVERFLPGGETGYQPAGPAPSGYHWNKADYFLRDGTFVAKGTKLVKNRRRNPANSKATNRAISRVASAKKHAQTLSRITIRKKACK